MRKAIMYEQKILATNIIIADTAWSRLMGFMFKTIPQDYDGLLIDPCRSIHTFFMRFSLDVVFLSNKGLVVKIIRDLKPWRLTWIYLKADQVLELPTGKLPPDLKEGQVLEVRDV